MTSIAKDDIYYLRKAREIGIKKGNGELLLDTKDDIYYINKALEINPHNLSAWRYKIHSTMDYDESYKYCMEALKANPNNIEIIQSIILILGICEKYDDALDWCAFALTLEPSNLDVLKSKANLLMDSERYEDATEVYDMILGFGLDDEFIINKAVNLSSIELDLGYNYIEELIKEYPNEELKYLKLREMVRLYLQEESDLNDLNRILKLSPYDEDALDSKISILEKSGDEEEIKKCYNKLIEVYNHDIEISPDNEYGYYGKILCFIKQNYPNKEITKVYDEAIKNIEDNENVLYNKACYLSALEDHVDEAIIYFKKAIDAYIKRNEEYPECLNEHYDDLKICPEVVKELEKRGVEQFNGYNGLDLNSEVDKYFEKMSIDKFKDYDITDYKTWIAKAEYFMHINKTGSIISYQNAVRCLNRHFAFCKRRKRQRFLNFAQFYMDSKK